MGEKERSLIYDMVKIRPGVMGVDFASGVDQALAEGETPRAAAYGKFENGRFGLLVATDSRLIGFDKGVLTRTVNVRDIPYDMVKTVNHKAGWMFGEITILTFQSGSIRMGTIPKEKASAFASWVRNRIGARGGNSEMGRGEHTTVASLGRVTTQSFADELTKLAALRDSNALTEAEFIEAKKRLLNR